MPDIADILPNLTSSADLVNYLKEAHPANWLESPAPSHRFLDGFCAELSVGQGFVVKVAVGPKGVTVLGLPAGRASERVTPLSRLGGDLSLELREVLHALKSPNPRDSRAIKVALRSINLPPWAV